MTCAEWEIEIEKRGHGALAPEAAAALDGHLSTCASCRSYSDVVQGTERTMQAAEAAVETRIDWERVRAGVERGARKPRWELWAGAVWAVVCIGVLVHQVPSWEKLAASGVAQAVLLIALAPAVVLSVIAYRYTRGRARSAGLARSSNGASLGWMREELDARIRARRSMLFFEVVLCALLAAVGVIQQVPEEKVPRLWFAAFLLAAVGDAAWTAFLGLPRLLRERAEFGE